MSKESDVLLRVVSGHMQRRGGWEQKGLSGCRALPHYWIILTMALAPLVCPIPTYAGSGHGAQVAEVILSATSSDGRTFSQDEGCRLTNGYVDPYVLRVQQGDWLMLVSTTPSSNRLPQKIYMAASTNGLNWQVDTNVLIAVEGGNALDPTTVALSNGTFRVYYIATPTLDPFANFYLTSGILRTNEFGRWSFTADGVSLGIYGVSPEALSLSGNTVRLYITSSSGGMKVYRAEDGLTFTEESAALPLGNDPSVIELPDHRLRMYYVNVNALGNKEIYTAISTDGLDWSEEGTTGIASDASSGNAWGVPDSFIDPDGKARLFWVAMPSVTNLPSLASPVPVFSASVGGSAVGRIQPDAAGAAVNFLGLSATAWSAYDLIGATVHALDFNQIAVVVMDHATRVPYLVKADENNTYQEHAALLGLSDSSVWASYAVDAAADVNADGFVEYVVRNRDSGYTLLAYTAGSTNQLQGTGPVLGIDPAGLAGYRIEGAGDADGDGYADLAVRDLGSGIVYMVHNDGYGGYDSVQPLFDLSADIWSYYHLESTGDFNEDGLLDYVVQDASQTVSYKLFGTGSNSFSGYEIIP